MKSALLPLLTIWRDNVGLDRVRYLFYGVSWQIKKRLGLSFITKLANGANVKVYPAMSYSGVFYSRWQERKDILFIRTHAKLARTFVDVGANTGLFSAQLFDKFSTFYLFEPASSSYSALLENCALNHDVDCRAFNLAVADRKCEVSFLDEGDFSSTGRIVPEIQAPDTNTRTVPAAPLDDVLSDVTEDMILKVDVEGAEQRVFKGAESLFKAQKFKLVMFERLGRTDLDAIRRFFERHDYLLFYVREDGSPTQDERLIQTPLINLFACPTTLREVIFPL